MWLTNWLKAVTKQNTPIITNAPNRPVYGERGFRDYHLNLRTFEAQALKILELYFLTYIFKEYVLSPTVDRNLHIQRHDAEKLVTLARQMDRAWRNSLFLRSIPEDKLAAAVAVDYLFRPPAPIKQESQVKSIDDLFRMEVPDDLQDGDV